MNKNEVKREAKKVREKRITVRLNDAEFELLKQKAELEGVAVSDLVRRAILRVKPRRLPEECRRLRGELGKIGGLLNQVARRANRNREVDLLASESLKRIEVMLVKVAEGVI